MNSAKRLTSYAEADALSTPVVNGARMARRLWLAAVSAFDVIRFRPPKD